MLILAAGLTGQVNAFDGPPREWLPGVINGRTVQIWGWRNYPSGVAHRYEENPHIYGPDRRVLWNVPTLAPGQKIGQDGAINNGVTMQAQRPALGLETNDRDLIEKLDLESERRPCPGPGPCPPDGPDVPDIPPLFPNKDPYAEWYVPGAILAGALVVGLLIRQSRASTF
jgi:hypothetical protein